MMELSMPAKKKKYRIIKKDRPRSIVAVDKEPIQSVQKMENITEAPIQPCIKQRIEPITELSDDQKTAFELYKLGYNVFISGPGGAGKTELIKRIVEDATNVNKTVQVCAMTGCAALLLNCGAKTIHSWSGIKRAIKPVDEICNDVMYNAYYKKAWKKTEILIIDEVSMMSRKIFELLHTIGQRVRKNKSCPFGGMQVIFVGDFYQLPPVPTDNSIIEESEFCFQSPQWYDVFPKTNHIILKHIFRQKDPIYKSILMQIREGNISEENAKVLCGRVYKSESEKVKIYPRKRSVENRNGEMFSELEGNIETFNVRLDKNMTKFVETDKTFDNITQMICNRTSKIQEEIEINNLLKCAPIEQSLYLKEGTRVMCTVNKDMDKGICNGSQGTVLRFENKIPVVLFDNGIEYKMDYHCWQSEFCPKIAIFQIPLIWAWAITVHKIQGTTLETAEIDVGSQIFEYGQTYVALSRIKTLEGLYLRGFDPSKIKANPIVKSFYEDLEKSKEFSNASNASSNTSSNTSNIKTTKSTKIIKINDNKNPVGPNKITHFFTKLN